MGNGMNGSFGLVQEQLYEPVCEAVTKGWAAVMPRIAQEERLPSELLMLTLVEAPLGPAFAIGADWRVRLRVFTSAPDGHAAVHGRVGSRIGVELSAHTGLPVIVVGCLLPQVGGWLNGWVACGRGRR